MDCVTRLFLQVVVVGDECWKKMREGPVKLFAAKHELRTGCWVWCLAIWMVGLTDTDLPCQALSIISCYGGPTQTTYYVCQEKSDLIGRGNPLKAVGIVVVIPDMSCCVSSSDKKAPQISQKMSSKRPTEGELDGRYVLNI